MRRWVAFLRAINVGGRVVKMDWLRARCAALGFRDVATFIASGNVVFRAGGEEATLVALLEADLHAGLGYEVATFLRSEAEVAALAAAPGLGPAVIAAARAVNVAFLDAPPAAAGVARLLAPENEVDRFVVAGREVWWLCQRLQSESTFSGAVLEKALGMRATVRGLNTVRRLAAKLGSPSPR